MWNLLFTHTPLLYFVQSIWRDEAFSILAAERSLIFLITKLGFEPPVYYTLLHFWVKIFGDSEVAARSLSLLGFILATVIIIEWSASMYKKHWLALYTPLFFFLNPMLLYYAFEVRTYGWYIFFTTASLYTYANKKWAWFVISSILGFYTHTYFILFLGTLGLHWIATHIHTLRSWKTIYQNKGFISFLTITIAILPWIAKIIQEASRLKNSWYFPVDINLVTSVLGNMFVGYEGTPWYGWVYTKILSAVILMLCILALYDKKNIQRNILFFIEICIPLTICIGISFIKPLFVNRYLISVSIAEVLIMVGAIHTIKNSYIQKILASSLLLLVFWISWSYPPLHIKLPIRDTMVQINALRKKSDVFFAASPIIYLEIKYYASDRSQVFLYNPNQGAFPWYVGDAVVSQSDMANDLPLYPARAFLIHDDGTYEIVYRTSVTYLTPKKNKK